MSIFNWSHNGSGRSPLRLDGGSPYAYAHGGRFLSGQTPYTHGSLPVLGVRIQYFVLVCYEEAGAVLYWRIPLYAYRVMFQIVGIMPAFQTRKVKIKSLKDYVCHSQYLHFKHCNSHVCFGNICPTCLC